MKLIVDHRTGERVEPEQWVERFDALWQGGRARTDDLVALLGPGIRLSAPGLRTTLGRDAAARAFRQTFEVLPDLTGRVLRWAASGDTLFIEMEFGATAGAGRITWKNVDRFTFHESAAVERVAFFNPGKLRKALLGSPRGWLQLIRRVLAGL